MTLSHLWITPEGAEQQQCSRCRLWFNEAKLARTLDECKPPEPESEQAKISHAITDAMAGPVSEAIGGPPTVLVGLDGKPIPAPQPVDYDQRIVAMLEDLIARVKEGRVTQVGAVALVDGKTLAKRYVGDPLVLLPGVVRFVHELNLDIDRNTSHGGLFIGGNPNEKGPA